MPTDSLVPQILFEGPGGQDLSAHDVCFSTTAHAGIRLSDALQGQLDDLTGRDEPAFSADTDVTAKISLRIHFLGREPYHRQITVRRSTSMAEPIALGKLAQKIAEETRACLQGGTLEVEGRTLSLEDMYLCRLRRASKGSWQPVFYARA
ncbi:hypothetical protein OH77DRAFT_1416113 [Trametes cingulata]|nr:hypothetical protein OH77DRAFT_1416113 [Trametes cingulata]